MQQDTVKDIVIVGGGSSGWMAASFLAKRFAGTLNITLVESPQIGIIGVGEATIPWMRTFIEELGISEQEFIKSCNASFKLGIEFSDWHKPGESYFHPFGPFGDTIDQVPFHHYWSRLRHSGSALPLDRYTIASHLARNNNFALPKAQQNQPDAMKFNYAFHFDAGLFAALLKSKACAMGVTHIEADITSVQQDTNSGFIQSISTNTGSVINGDFFIDCSGFKGLLIEETLATGFNDWSHWLPCDSAVAMQSAHTTENIPSYTQSQAKSAGWQWSIPLQNRIGNGYVYCSQYSSDDEAIADLTRKLEPHILTAPKKIKFTTGIRKKIWNKNVLSLGLASGFLEPLESTSIYLVQSGLARFYKYFPQRKSQMSALANQLNAQMLTNMELLRDFLVLHYHLNQRVGEPFWDHCRHMPIPDSLRDRMREFKTTGNLLLSELDFFRLDSWLAIFSGYDFVPDYWHPKVDNHAGKTISDELTTIVNGLCRAAKNTPNHQAFLKSIFS